MLNRLLLSGLFFLYSFRKYNGLRSLPKEVVCGRGVATEREASPAAARCLRVVFMMNFEEVKPKKILQVVNVIFKNESLKFENERMDGFGVRVSCKRRKFETSLYTGISISQHLVMRNH